MPVASVLDVAALSQQRLACAKRASKPLMVSIHLLLNINLFNSQSKLIRCNHPHFTEEELEPDEARLLAKN